MPTKVTALLEAKNELSPELVSIQQEVKKTRRAFGGMDQETKKAIQDIGKMGGSIDRLAREFSRDTHRMERDIQQLRSEMKRVDGTRIKPKVDIEDRASNKLQGIREKLLGLGALATAFVIGDKIGDVKSEAELAAREKAKYAANHTSAEVDSFNQNAPRLMLQNPYLQKSETMAVLSQAERYFGKEKAFAYAQEAVQMELSTGRDKTEIMKAMSALRENYKVDDVKRIASSIQHMVTNTRDLKDELFESIVEYTPQMAKFTRTPEQFAAITEYADKLGVWSLDKAHDSFKEGTLKLANQGDLANVLKAGYEALGIDSKSAKAQAEKESAMVQQKLNNGTEEEQRRVLSTVLMNLTSIKDKSAQQQVLNEFLSGAGEDVTKKVILPLFQYAGKLSMGQIKPNISRDYSTQAYQKATQNNEFFELQKSQAETMNSFENLASTVTKDATPFLATLNKGTAWVADKMNGMPDWARNTAEVGVAGGAVTSLGFAAIQHLRAAKALLDAARALNRPGGGIGLGGGDQKGGSGKRKWWNPFTWRRKEPPPKKWLSAEEAAKKALYGPDPRTYDKITFGDKLLKGTTKFLPIAGTAVAAHQLIQSKDKGDTLIKIGFEAGGGAAGGAMAGAAVGSVVPVIGTAIGSIVGGIGGAIGGGMLYESVKGYLTPVKASLNTMFRDLGNINSGKPIPSKPLTPMAPLTPMTKLTPMTSLTPVTSVKPAPLPVVPPKGKTEKPKIVSLSIPSMPITLKADGILQDVNGILRLLRTSAVASEVIHIVEKALHDALETKGGVVT